MADCFKHVNNNKANLHLVWKNSDPEKVLKIERLPSHIKCAELHFNTAEFSSHLFYKVTPQYYSS